MKITGLMFAKWIHTHSALGRANASNRRRQAQLHRFGIPPTVFLSGLRDQGQGLIVALGFLERQLRIRTARPIDGIELSPPVALQLPVLKSVHRRIRTGV